MTRLVRLVAALLLVGHAVDPGIVHAQEGRQTPDELLEANGDGDVTTTAPEPSAERGPESRRGLVDFQGTRWSFSAGDLFWLFLIVIALQPLISRRLLDAARQRCLERIEAARKSRVITLVHRQETMSLLGFPLLRYIDIEDGEQVVRAIHTTEPDEPIDLVLHTPGGLVLASLQIALALHRHKGRVTVFVPHYAMSGGTLIALAADEIVLAPHAVLGPVDPQLGRHPAASVLRVLREKPLEKIDDETIILADQAEKAIAEVRQAVVDLLADTYPTEKAEAIADALATGRYPHDYPITLEVAGALGLPVRDDLPEEIYHLLQLFPQPVRRRPAVEYLDGHRPNAKP